MRRALAVLGLAAPLAAQDAPVRGPLRPLADHPVPVIPAPRLPGLLVEAPPAVGLFRFAGIAAGLPSDITGSRGVLRVGAGKGSGPYRRPFDADAVTPVTLRAAGWQRVGGRGAAWGRVAIENGGRDPAGFASYTNPYGSAPLVLADTSTSRLHRVRAVLEGAMGWSVGAWTVGVAGGLDVIDDGTRASRFVRTNRASRPAVHLSVGRALFGGITAVLHGRWSGGSETVFLRPEPGESRAFFFSGFDDPLPTDIVPPGALFRRTQKDGYAAGAAVAGRLFGAPWLVSAARTYRHDIHFHEARQNPPTDDWIADGWDVTAAHQRPLPFGIVGTLELDVRRLVGDATLQGIDGVVTRVRETLLDATLDLRAMPAPDIQAAVRLGMAVSRRQLDDFLVRIGADLVVWRPSAVAEVAYAHRGTAVAVAGGVAGAGPYATLPNPAAMGAVYQRFIAPAWSRAATRATTLVGGVTVRQRVSSRVSLLAEGSLASLSPRGTPVLASPDGRFREWRVNVGVVGAR